MGKKCDICGRSSTKGASRSHSNIKTLKRQGINLQNKNVMGIKAKICTTCLRTMKKNDKIEEEKKQKNLLKQAEAKNKNKTEKKEVKKGVKKEVKKTVKKSASKKSTKK
ncbi:50S ribosomal protein L28 [Patescibacteria group bacterium]|jgi:ribosomal protein L28|nr:50S ribosomal protein L28 [Patescibacteria group bacterium]